MLPRYDPEASPMTYLVCAIWFFNGVIVTVISLYAIGWWSLRRRNEVAKKKLGDAAPIIEAMASMPPTDWTGPQPPAGGN